jgi:heptosyltransferase-1
MGPKPKQVILTSNQPLLDNKNKKTIIFCNGGFSDLKFFKNWLGYSLLSKTLKNFYPNSLIIKIGFGKELENISADINYVGKLTLSETAKVISQANLMISTDTGNMHIADALGVPLIVLWGGSSITKNKPYETKSKIIHLGLECQKLGSFGHCKRQQCKQALCLNNITVEMVMFYVQNFFKDEQFES